MDAVLPTTSESKLLILTENDIPGAKLQKDVEECSFPQLKRWLLCRGSENIRTKSCFNLQVNVDCLSIFIVRRCLKTSTFGSLFIVFNSRNYSNLTCVYISFNRVKDYIRNGFDVKYLRDPDGGVNLLKKKAELGLLDNKEPSLTETFPKDGFNTDLLGIPKVNFGTVWMS